jgi:hypothetical protein
MSNFYNERPMIYENTTARGMGASNSRLPGDSISTKASVSDLTTLNAVS